MSAEESGVTGSVQFLELPNSLSDDESLVVQPRRSSRVASRAREPAALGRRALDSSDDSSESSLSSASDKRTTLPSQAPPRMHHAGPPRRVPTAVIERARADEFRNDGPVAVQTLRKPPGATELTARQMADAQAYQAQLNAYKLELRRQSWYRFALVVAGINGVDVGELVDIDKAEVRRADQLFDTVSDAPGSATVATTTTGISWFDSATDPDPPANADERFTERELQANARRWVSQPRVHGTFFYRPVYAGALETALAEVFDANVPLAAPRLRVGAATFQTASDPRVRVAFANLVAAHVWNGTFRAGRRPLRASDQQLNQQLHAKALRAIARIRVRGDLLVLDREAAQRASLRARIARVGGRSVAGPLNTPSSGLVLRRYLNSRAGYDRFPPPGAVRAKQQSFIWPST